MKNYFVIEPEVAGGLGEHTAIDRSSGKMKVTKLHYEFDGWLGDQLLESSPCFIASDRLASEISREQLEGVEFDNVEVTTSEQFLEMYPDRELPKFVWMKVIGSPGQDDFGIASGLRLVVSERALRLLSDIGIANAASVEPFNG